MHHIIHIYKCSVKRSFNERKERNFNAGVSQINFPAVRALRFHHAKEPRETEREANDTKQNASESKVVLHHTNLLII